MNRGQNRVPFTRFCYFLVKINNNEVNHSFGYTISFLFDIIVRVNIYQMATDNESTKIVKNLKKNFEKLKNKGEWTQGTLSQEAKLAYHTIAKIESGSTKDPRVSTVKKIADALGVTVDELIK